MGTIGDSHNLLTPEYGPRLRIVSVLTDAPIIPDKPIAEDLCIHCEKCMRACPVQCFQPNAKGLPYKYDKIACTQHHVDIKNNHHWPCGICINVCPVGDDLKKYRGSEFITEHGIKHAQSHGS